MPSPTRSPDRCLEGVSDASLMSRIAAREAVAFEALMARYQERMLHFAFEYLQDRETARDLVQESFARAYQHAGNYKPAYAVSTWLFNILLNLCRDHTRRRKFRRFLSLDWRGDASEDSAGLAERIPDPAENVEDMLHAHQRTLALEKAIDTLPHDLKAALILYHLEERSQEQCARILGITEKAVETRVYRARKQLKQKLGGMIEG